MFLYDIHTHHHWPKEIEEYPLKYVLNVTPSEIDSMESLPSHAYFSCGVHPWDAEKPENALALLEKNAERSNIVAIGECGLDKLQGPPLACQLKVFQAQIDIAYQQEKPLIIHCVKAWDELIALRKKYDSSIAWILHGFRGNRYQVEQLLAFGLKFSIGANFNAEAVLSIPFDSLFCETDMSEESILTICQRIAHSKGCELDILLREIENNTKNTFKLL